MQMAKVRTSLNEAKNESEDSRGGKREIGQPNPTFGPHTYTKFEDFNFDKEVE